MEKFDFKDVEFEQNSLKYFSQRASFMRFIRDWWVLAMAFYDQTATYPLVFYPSGRTRAAWDRPNHRQSVPSDIYEVYL